MPYQWQNEAERDAPPKAERIPCCTNHPVRIVKIVLGGKDGPFTSRHGDPQIMLVFQDREAREASQMITLSNSAAWVLAKYLGCCDPPANLARMEAEGIEPEAFAQQEFADANLLDRQLNIDVVKSKNPDYPDIIPVKPQPAAATPASPPPAQSEVPPSSTPPPSTESPPLAPPTGLTKDEAWAKVLEVWPGTTVEQQQQRNNAWLESIKDIGKPEPQMTPADWLTVANEMTKVASDIPF